ncbi:SHOCT domain-containing protein [Streptomyces sp. H39-S7]|uniref:SHOCT domain-containing protein n=1 Tax=Streptomyces sp. H39-S7 TaxID=3004357 RepID=UPI0022AE72D5|nr:SHOCT domain-containing protein [Streptomyces sp. H39-S7]MCZ4120775.1 SHOCT domain-containing protein [Streptomyces sp. H39-S7]
MDNYPMLDLFWTMLLIFCWVLWFFLLFRIISDLFRDHELNGWAKAGWMILVIVLPFLGVLAYVIVRGRGMSHREAKQAEAQQTAFKQYVREAAGTPDGTNTADNSVDQLHKLSELKSRGDLTEAEYAQAKARVLARS